MYLGLNFLHAIVREVVSICFLTPSGIRCIQDVEEGALYGTRVVRIPGFDEVGAYTENSAVGLA